MQNGKKTRGIHSVFILTDISDNIMAATTVALRILLQNQPLKIPEQTRGYRREPTKTAGNWELRTQVVGTGPLLLSLASGDAVRGDAVGECAYKERWVQRGQMGCDAGVGGQLGVGR